jgi:indolepyruvate ferredoxin oxidoreductase alpha subunit
MERIPDLLVKPEPFEGLMMGNQALARAMIEADVKVATAYPGSPTPEIAGALLSIPEDVRPLTFHWATNEKVALEVAFGAAINGHFSCAFFKSVGLNVASDSAVQLAMMNIIGGMVIVLGDDPGANSSQNEQDNRHFSRMSYIPMYEPATPQEAYQMFLDAAAVSKQMMMPVIVRLTTHVCHARQNVQFGKFEKSHYDWTPRFDKQNGPYFPITADVFPLKRNALSKLGEMAAYSETAAVNKILAPNGKKPIAGQTLGIISASMPANSVLENLFESGNPIDLLKLGITYPLPRKKILDFLDAHDQVLIIEELDQVMEKEIKAWAWENQSRCQIFARTDREDLMGELGPERTWKLLSSTWPAAFEPRPPLDTPKMPMPRVAQMCPGCGHRAAFWGIAQAFPDTGITVADIGCHSLGAYSPYEMGEVLLCMGHSSGTASGMTFGNDSRKVLSFIGDSTFFHAGLPAIINAVVNDYDFTLVVMENGTTAMTGHQPHPGSGEIGDKIPIRRVLESLGVKFLRDMDTYNQKALQKAVKEAIEHKGFSVIIARHPCMLKFTREQRKKGGFHPTTMHVDENCDQHHVCVSDFACPSFIRADDQTVTVHPDLCIGDGSCVATCPVGALSFEKKAKE